MTEAKQPRWWWSMLSIGLLTWVALWIRCEPKPPEATKWLEPDAGAGGSIYATTTGRFLRYDPGFWSEDIACANGATPTTSLNPFGHSIHVVCDAGVPSP